MQAQGSFPDSGRPALRWAATGRAGGVSAPPFDSLNIADHVGDDPDAVTLNRARMAALVGLDGAAVAVMRAAHGASVAVVERAGTVDAVDALVTTRPGLGLIAIAADCVPLALAADDEPVIGAIHCGWPGLAAGVVDATVAVMRDLGATKLRAVLGPSICARCYPVPRERVDVLRAAVSADVAAVACIDDGYLVDASDAQPRIDVAAGVVAQLAELGVPSTRLPGCTAETGTLFSYRRACQGDGRTGRQGMIVRQ